MRIHRFNYKEVQHKYHLLLFLSIYLKDYFPGLGRIFSSFFLLHSFPPPITNSSLVEMVTFLPYMLATHVFIQSFYCHSKYIYYGDEWSGACEFAARRLFDL